MEEASGSVGLDGDKVADTDEDHQMETAHLGLNPGKMKEMRIFMFPNEDVNESEDSRDQTSDHMTSLTKRNVVQKTPLSLLDYKPALFMGRPFQAGWGRTYMTPLTKRNAVPKTPLSLLDYNPALFMGRPFQAGWGRTYMTPLTKRNAVPKTPLSLLDYNPALFMGRPFQAGWGRTYMTPLTKRNAVPKTPLSLLDYNPALFMGRPFQAGWGRTGKPICNSNSQIVLSSVVNNEKIAIGKVAWDRKEKVLEELIDSAFEAPLSLHKELDHQEEEVRFGSFCLKLQRVVTDLSDVCPSYIGIIEKQSRNNSQKKKGISLDGTSVLCEHSKEITDLFPTLNTPDYFLKPCMNELVEREIEDPGYCSRVPDFTIGRIGYGSIRFLGNTDVRRLDLDQIVKFKRHEVVVYNDESSKPVVGEGLNKAAEVTLIINIRNLTWGKEQVDQIASKLKQSTERQGATFISFDPDKGLWKFLAPHFSRYGLSDDEAEAEDFEESEDKSSGGKSGKRRKNRKRKRNCADPKVEKVRTTVWWDYENASIPYDLPPEELYGRFVKKLGEEGFTGPVKLKTYVPFKNTMQPRVRNDLYKGLSIELKKNLKVKVVYKFNRPANVRRKNQIADTAIINSIRKWLKKGYKPQNAMLVTGDSDFKDVLQELQKAGHRTLVAFRDLSSPEIVSAKVSDNAMLKWDWRQFLSLPLNSISKKARDAAFRQKKADEAAKLEKMRKSVEKKKKKKKTPDILGDLLRSVQVPVPDATRVKSVEKKKKKKKTPDILDDEQRLRLSQRVRDYGLREVEMSGDGNCQFRAISDQLYGSSEYHMEVRKGIVTQLKENRQWYEGFDVQDYDQYCKTIASPGTWGDHVTLQAAADRFNVRIILLTSIQDTVVREIAPREGEPRTDLWLSFLSELHYNSLYVDDQAPSDH